MDATLSSTLLQVLLTLFSSGLFSALITYMLNRKKVKAETKKKEAETSEVYTKTGLQLVTELTAKNERLSDRFDDISGEYLEMLEEDQRQIIALRERMELLEQTIRAQSDELLAANTEISRLYSELEHVKRNANLEVGKLQKKVVELQGRIAELEAENRRLKEARRTRE